MRSITSGDRQVGVGDQRRAADQREALAVGTSGARRSSRRRRTAAARSARARRARRGGRDARDCQQRRRTPRRRAPRPPRRCASLARRRVEHPHAPVEADEVEHPRHLPAAADDRRSAAPDRARPRRRAGCRPSRGTRPARRSSTIRRAARRGGARPRADARRSWRGRSRPWDDDDGVARAPTRHLEVRPALHRARSSQGARRSTSPDFLSRSRHEFRALVHERGVKARIAS